MAQRPSCDRSPFQEASTPTSQSTPQVRRVRFKSPEVIATSAAQTLEETCADDGRAVPLPGGTRATPLQPAAPPFAPAPRQRNALSSKPVLPLSVPRWANAARPGPASPAVAGQPQKSPASLTAPFANARVQSHAQVASLRPLQVAGIPGFWPVPGSMRLPRQFILSPSGAGPSGGDTLGEQGFMANLSASSATEDTDALHTQPSRQPPSTPEVRGTAPTPICTPRTRWRGRKSPRTPAPPAWETATNAPQSAEMLLEPTPASPIGSPFAKKARRAATMQHYLAAAVAAALQAQSGPAALSSEQACSMSADSSSPEGDAAAALLAMSSARSRRRAMLQ